MFGAFFGSKMSDKSIKPLSLDVLRRARRPNDFVFVDADLSAIKAHGRSVRVSGVGAEAIHAAIEAYAVGEKGGTLRDREPLSGVFVIRTPRMAFPNGLYYWLNETEDGGFRVSLYSRSIFGYRGYGANAAYVRALSKRLAALSARPDERAD